MVVPTFGSVSTLPYRVDSGGWHGKRLHSIILVYLRVAASRRGRQLWADRSRLEIVQHGDAEATDFCFPRRFLCDRCAAVVSSFRGGRKADVVLSEEMNRGSNF
jgi:hypothetical protein